MGFRVLVEILWFLSLFSTSKLGLCQEVESQRNKRLLSLFQIITFPNDPCVGNAGKNGTCYTNEECSSRGGNSGGSCAQGYGVCCTFSVNCGATSSENCTYFESMGSEIGGCRATICPCGNNICQLRLDFDMFVITGPSTSMDEIGLATSGQISGAGPAVSSQTRCLTDLFSVGDPNGCAPPSICGTNSGEHMYVDAAEACNDLTFELGQQGIGTGIANRQWSIKVTQYSCDFKNLAPEGCTQYFFGNENGAVQTYNYANEIHLANQNQNICIRRERGNCRICYTTEEDADFSVSGMAVTVKTSGDLCCGYGTDGMATDGYDCVQIPGARVKTAPTEMIQDVICGMGLGIGSVGTTKTICSNIHPFNLRFTSDQFDFMTETGIKGFRLLYSQDSTDC